jgi:hypothetical protein
MHENAMLLASAAKSLPCTQIFSVHITFKSRLEDLEFHYRFDDIVEKG